MKYWQRNDVNRFYKNFREEFTNSPTPGRGFLNNSSPPGQPIRWQMPDKCPGGEGAWTRLELTEPLFLLLLTPDSWATFGAEALLIQQVLNAGIARSNCSTYQQGFNAIWFSSVQFKITVLPYIRPGSDAELFMHEPNLIRIEVDPNFLDLPDSDANLNCSWTKFKRWKLVISVKLLTKSVIIIYALGSVHEKFGVWIKAVPKSLQRRNSRSG